MKRKARIRIGLHEAGTNVVELLTDRFTYHGRDNWLECIRSGKILVNGRIAVAERILSEGDILEYLPGDMAEPPVDMRFSVLYDDPWLLAVDKSGYLPCHPGGRYFNHTLWARLKHKFNLASVFFVNRIDRETSGIVLAAKTPEAAAALRTQFDAHQVVKRYIAVVEGLFPSRVISACGFMLRDHESLIRKKFRFYPETDETAFPAGAKACRTRFRNLESRNGLSIIEAMPETGRLHQIRATLAALGYCIVGDKIYGVDETLFLRFIQEQLSPEDRLRLRLPRQALHAAELHFRHPATGTMIRLHAPLPADMKHLIDSGPPSYFPTVG